MLENLKNLAKYFLVLFLILFSNFQDFKQSVYARLEQNKARIDNNEKKIGDNKHHIAHNKHIGTVFENHPKCRIWIF